jgi:osmotically-inducible protein OsmY
LNRRSQTRRIRTLIRTLALTVPLIAVAALSACSSTPRTQPQAVASDSVTAEAPADRILASNVYWALNASPVYYFRHVDVRVENGVAELSGYVWSTDAIYEARRIARTVPGITAVRSNQLQLERNGRDASPAR